jgi:hypothetical protein
MTGTMPRPKPEIPRIMRSLRLPANLWAAMDAAAKANRRPLTTQIEIALEEHLKALGLWPPPPGSHPPKKK